MARTGAFGLGAAAAVVCLVMLAVAPPLSQSLKASKGGSHKGTGLFGKGKGSKRASVNSSVPENACIICGGDSDIIAISKGGKRAGSKGSKNRFTSLTFSWSASDLDTLGGCAGGRVVRVGYNGRERGTHVCVIACRVFRGSAGPRV